jgi:hypothetical protein
LHKLAKDHDNADNFIINGTITFGILIDFNQNCNFEGNLNSLIQIGTSQVPMNVDTYGFVVGATIAPITDDGYNGKLYIAPSVNVHVVSNASMYGVNIQKTKFGSIQIINGNFTLTNANQDTTISDAYGINIDEANGSSIIDGTFSLYFQSVMNNVACIRITGSGVGAMQIINGNFSVDCNASGQRGLVGVLIGQNQLLPQLGNFVINGVFTINNSNSSDYAAGVQISTTQTGLFGINGVFTLSANGNVYGVNSLSTIPTPNQIIIDGYFCLLAGGQNLTYGVTTGINGLYMDDTRFYSNKTNSGYIPNEDTNQNDYY